MRVKRRKSRLTGRWVWDIVNEDGIIVSHHFHSKEEATETLKSRAWTKH